MTIALQGDYGKPRPALVLQSDLFSEHPSVTVLPVTSEMRGAFPGLEDEMCAFGPKGLASGRSPDRLDALVRAVTALVRGQARGEPRVRGV